MTIASPVHLSALAIRLRNGIGWRLNKIATKLRELPGDLPDIIRFVARPTRTPSTLWQRLGLVRNCYRISYFVNCPHTEREMIRVMEAIFSLPPDVSGVVVEAGVYQGGSGAKISHAAKLAGRMLYLFDSYEGLPANNEEHGQSIFGEQPDFSEGKYRGTLDEVRRNIERYGEIDICRFVKGWFDATMPGFKEPVTIAYIDVDLRASTATCLKYLYPLLVRGGTIFSQDGHLPLVIDLLRDDEFWRTEVGVPRPPMAGLGTVKLVAIPKTV